ncbi:hypothetical protein ID866_7754 [Astraeus odoratus]|nr:hypothetical protein ID866_7754 [Astraeus odoratus]
MNLGICMQCRYQSQGALGDLEEAISHIQQALELHPIGHHYRSSSLMHLGICIQSRYGSQGAWGDLEEAISLHKQALGLYPNGHPNRSTSLDNLANCMQCKYESHKALNDLEEAISLHQQALELYPVGHPDRSSSLMNLAICMRFKYESCKTWEDLEKAISLHQQALELHVSGHPHRVWDDLEEAISLHRQALELCPVGHPDRSTSLSNLANSILCRYKSQGALRDLEEAISLFYQASQLISNSIQEILHSIPPRLLQTNTGILATQEQMIAQFHDSAQYQTLVTALEHESDWHSIHSHMQATIALYFQYATLSHRWGPKEPSLQEILGNGSVYKMALTEGIVKLQKFCYTAAHHGYSWAWSDTCCIDKSNSVELQEAIGCMFLWYQNSALTIVHLADISSSSSPAALSSSVWFRRGWTLQELLAPHTLLFYTQDWLLYRNSTAKNHKEDVSILKELEQATGIPCHHINNFHIGMDNARSRLQWATGRHTSRPEDIAYSLFGIFDLHLPVLYGEGKEKSLARLLQEILSQSSDISILHWIGEQSSRHSCFPANISAYQPLPCVEPKLTSLASERSMLRLQRLVCTEDAQKVYNNFTNLPRARFSNRTLTVPCIVHQVHMVKLRQTHMNNYTYDVQAVGLRPMQIVTREELMEASDPSKLPYVFIRPWDRKLVNYSEQDHVMAGYKILMQLGQPFMALMLQRLPEGEYKRICASHLIVVHSNDPVSIVNSTATTLDII